MNAFTKTLCAVTVCTFGATAHAAYAAPPGAERSKPEDNKPEPTPDTIEVLSTRAYDARKEDTASKIVVNAAEITKFGDTQLADVLKRLPGITVQGTSVRMRGLAGYTQILIDGERAPAGLTIDQIPPNDIERIEIIRAATAEFSTQSVAGTINIVMKKKITKPQREIRLQYDQSEYSHGQRVSFVASDKAGDWAYSVTGHAYRSESGAPKHQIDSASDATGRETFYRFSEDRDDSKDKGVGLDPRLTWTSKNGDTLTWQTRLRQFGWEAQSNARYTVARGTLPLFMSSDFVGSIAAQIVRSDLNWVAKFDGGVKLDTKIGLGYVTLETSDFNRGFNTANQQNYERLSKLGRTTREFTFTGKYSTPLVEGHVLMAGWDAGASKRNQNKMQRDQKFPGVLPVIPNGDSDDQSDALVVRFAAFVQDEWNVTKQWSVYAGLRWEGVATTTEGTGYQAVTNRSSVWSPLAQTLYKLPDREGEQLRFALTRTYKAPPINSLLPTVFRTEDNKPTTPDFQGNPNLRPELATGVDLTAEKFWGNGASISLSSSLRRITGYQRTGLRFINGRWVNLPINDGTALSRSLEFDTKIPVQKIYASAPNIDLRLNLNRNWSDVDSVSGPNNRLDNQTPFSATAGFDVRSKSDKFSGGGSYSFSTAGVSRLAVNVEAWRTATRNLEFYGLWKVNPKTQFRVTFYNVLHRASTNQTTYADASGRSQTTIREPTKPNVRLGLEMKL